MEGKQASRRAEGWTPTLRQQGDGCPRPHARRSAGGCFGRRALVSRLATSLRTLYLSVSILSFVCCTDSVPVFIEECAKPAGCVHALPLCSYAIRSAGAGAQARRGGFCRSRSATQMPRCRCSTVPYTSSTDDPRFLVTRAEALLQLCDFQSAAANLRRALNLSKGGGRGVRRGAATGSSRFSHMLWSPANSRQCVDSTCGPSASSRTARMPSRRC